MGYNGHKNWNHWNVSLWLANSEGLYRASVAARRRHRTLDDAARYLKQYLPEKTPDGAPYSLSAIKAAIRDL